MKKIGMIGGITFSSSSESYRMIAEKANSHLYGYHTAEILIISINPDEVLNAIQIENWEKIANTLTSTAIKLEQMGADCIMIPCNTVHKIAQEIQNKISVPFINMMDCVGNYIKKMNYTKVGLLGTRLTMEDDFYRDHLSRFFQIETVIPQKDDRVILHNIIFDELCKGIFSKEARLYVKKLCNTLHHSQGCDAVILGCTELPLLIKQDDTDTFLIDTIDVQADFVVDFARNDVSPLRHNVSGIQ